MRCHVFAHPSTKVLRQSSINEEEEGESEDEKKEEEEEEGKQKEKEGQEVQRRTHSNPSHLFKVACYVKETTNP